MNIEAAYQSALNYLYRFVDYSLSRSFRYAPDKFDLARMHRLMAALGEPQRAYPIIHVAGTKGKGSVSAMCASVLRAAGYRTGLYTSPHLQDYAERIQVDGQPISHADLVDLLEEMKPQIEAVEEITTFEITTALAFLYFARQNVAAAVIEVGLGGRLDATNVVLPTVAVITSLSYDHTALLGNTLAEIAGEKGGIIKQGVPVVLAPQKDEARLIIQRIAGERNAPLFQVGQDYRYGPLSRSLDGQTLLLWPAESQPLMDRYLEGEPAGGWVPDRLTLSLLGQHQIENAATAYAALQLFGRNGLPVPTQALQRGFAQVIWPGRFEVLQRDPPVVVDSAHNRDSALKLRLALDDYFPGREVVLVFGASEDKDIEGMFSELLPVVRRVIATKSFHPRAIEPERLVELAHQYGRPARIVPDVAEALKEALQTSGENVLILVAGSLFVAAGARQAWYEQALDDKVRRESI